MTLADLVRQTRLDNAMTQQELANKLKLHLVTISNLENGRKAGPKVLKAISKFMNMETRILRKMMEER
jgi:transcriptional regulator with XRE-family HTH domain